MASPYSLPALLHCKLQNIPSHLQHNLLIQDTLVAWRVTRHKLKLSPWVLRYLPIHENPSFQSIKRHVRCTVWASQNLSHFVQLFDPSTGSALPIHHLLSHFRLAHNHFLYIHQAVQHVSSLCPTKIQRFHHSFLDTLLEKQQYKISDIYKPLNTHLSKPIQVTSAASWNKDFNSPEALDRILSSYNSTCALVVAQILAGTAI